MSESPIQDRRSWDWEREAAEQMASKLEAQMCLRTICEAIDLPLGEITPPGGKGGWAEGLPTILGRIETIVDEAERAFRERNAARDALHRCRRDFHNKVLGRA